MRVGVGVCVVAWLAAAPAWAKGSIVEIEAAGTFDARTLDSSLGPPNPSGGSWLGGDGSLALTVFGSRVHDDDAAPPLQPFLQRTTRFRFEGGAGGASITYPLTVENGVSPVALQQKDVGGHAAFSVDGYLGRWIYLGARFGVGYQTWAPQYSTVVIGGFNPSMQYSPQFIAGTNSNELLLDGTATFGLRIRDVLISVGWHVTPFRPGDGAMQVRFWGGAFAQVRAMLRRFVELDARFEVLDEGFFLGGGATVWLAESVGLTLGVDGGRGALPDSPTIFQRAGGRVGIAWWPAARFGMALAYAPAWQRTTPVDGLGTAVDQFAFVQHLVTLTITGRAR